MTFLQGPAIISEAWFLFCSGRGTTSRLCGLVFPSATHLRLLIWPSAILTSLLATLHHARSWRKVVGLPAMQPREV